MFRDIGFPHNGQSGTRFKITLRTQVAHARSQQGAVTALRSLHMVHLNS